MKNGFTSRKKRLFSCLLACILLCFSLASCAPDAEQKTEYLRFCDSTGEEVVLYRRPERVAVLFSSFAEMWTLAGGRVFVSVGESVERGFCSPDTPLVDAGAGKTINLELLIAQSPDLVICSADIAAQADAAALLKEAGIPCALFRVESFADYLSVLRIMTDITGDTVAYAQNGQAVKAQIDALKETYAQKAGEKILFIRAGSSARSTKAKDADGHFAASMLEELGCSNVADNAPLLLDGLSIEEILREDPDRIFITTMGDEDSARAYMDSLLEGEIWSSLTAVKCGKVHYLPKDLFQFKPNARWGTAYRYLAEILYENDSDATE